MRSIAKYRGHKEDLAGTIFGRLEFHFFPKVGHVKETKHCAHSSDAAYNYAWINCLRKRRPGLSLSSKRC